MLGVPFQFVYSYIVQYNLQYFEKKSFHDCKQSIADDASLVGPGFPSITDALRCLPTATLLGIDPGNSCCTR